MEAKRIKLECGFDMLFTKSVPHIQEKIFLNLDYSSFKQCMKVSLTWRELLSSDSYKRLGKDAFQEDMNDELQQIFTEGTEHEAIRILSSGMVDVKYPYNSVNLLFCAANNDWRDVVKLLLREDAEVNRRSGAYTNGLAPLHITALKGYNDVAKLLLQGGAEINIQDNFGYTPLHKAASQGHNKTVKLLVHAGADLNKRCFQTYGPTPRSCALFNRHYETANLLRVLGGNR